MDVRRFAAIDIGSNSVRLLVEQVFVTPSETRFSKITLLRLPVRLGEDTFSEQRIRPSTIERLCDAMSAFSSVMRLHEVVHYKAAATSAMREAENADDVLLHVMRRTGIPVQVLSGDEEAGVINLSQSAFAKKLNKNCLFIDVGGGSTETVVFTGGVSVAEHSFQIGTIRLLKDKVKKSEWKSLQLWLDDHIQRGDNLTPVGSGGNINRLYKLIHNEPGKALRVSQLKKLVRDLSECSVDERMERYGLHPDRADVIVPAGEIFLSILSHMGAEHMYVPKLGLSDGLVKQAYREYYSQHRITAS
ncbi:MAG: exopolyphosphatase [Candidatus Kapaibacterium sp.]|jgi:exopolyphosphatase/guanosine-5'-triphosphate,3'-diphosphate pyrophosphatase